jgi:hypothetical protein
LSLKGLDVQSSNQIQQRDPPAVALLYVPHRKRRHFRPAQSAAEEHGDESRGRKESRTAWGNWSYWNSKAIVYNDGGLATEFAGAQQSNRACL